MVKTTNSTGELPLAPMSSKRKKIRGRGQQPSIQETEDPCQASRSQPSFYPVLSSNHSFSCGECHRRKQKCDRQVPCSHCVARKVPELCKAYTPGKSDHDLNARIARLEHIIETALPQYCDMSFRGSTRRHSPSQLDDDIRSQNDDESTGAGGLFQSGKWYGNSASGSIAPGPVIEQLQNAVMPKSPIQARMNDRPNGIDPLEPSAADNLKTLVQECGVSPHKIPELLQELPPLRTSEVLINYYFRQINWTRYAISEKEFRAAYTTVCAHGAHGVGATNPNDIRFLPLLFVVLAISARLAPEEIAGDARSRRVTSLRYYWSSRRSLLIAAAIQPDSLDIVLTRLLSARFLTFDRRITECWSQLGAAVRTAEALGLHRDGSSMGMDPHMVEYRRRVWSYLYHADRSYALVLGRPNSIQDDYVSTLPPSNIDDELPDAFTNAKPSPGLSNPTRLTFCILRHQLASIIGRIVHHFQKVRPSHYSEVMQLDEELENFMVNLPPHYSFDPDTSLDDKHPFIPVHRFLLITETLFVRTSLHRPYILRRLSSDRYSRSRNTCFQSAMKDFEVRQAFRETTNDETRISLSNAYREFQTAMISGIYLVINPHGRDADIMHTILDTFLKDHEGLKEMDETTVRELKTIEFLKNKAVERSQPFDESEENGAGHDPAQLLLGFQQQSSGPPPPAIAQPNGNMPRSPMFHHRLLAQPAGDHLSSTSGSPAADDDSTAQMIFNIVSNPMEGPQWGMNAAASSSNGEFNGWTGSDQSMSMQGADPRFPVEPADWTYYWEALVNQIPRGPGP